MNKIIIYIALLFVACNNISAQHQILSSFTGFQNDNTIILNWKIKSGSQCQGMNIERSPDTIFFQKIGTIEGVCGSSVKEVSYSFTDESPIPNAVNYYRLELGLQGYSEYIAIRYYALNENGYSVLSYNESGKSTILFKNDKNKNYSYQLYDIKGRLIQSELINNDRFEINQQKIGKGIFIFFILEDNYPKIKGKIYL